jgi:hypothetical protein
MYSRKNPSVRSYKIPVVVDGEKVTLKTSYKVDFTQPIPVRWSEAFGRRFATYEAPGGGFFSRLLDGLSPWERMMPIFYGIVAAAAGVGFWKTGSRKRRRY